MLTVVLVAAVPRVVLAIVTVSVRSTYLIPDESQYVGLANAISHGTDPNVWYPYFGRSLYISTWAFSAPLSVLFDVFGTSRAVGALFAAAAGVAAAGMTTAIGLRFLSRPFAIAAGLVVALTPSQILFSSVVLREGHVWLALTIVALGALRLARPDRRDVAIGLGLAAAGLLALGYLRSQTLVAAAWALPLAMLLTPRRWWLARVPAALALALTVPLIAGLGIGGWSLVSEAVPRLGTTRAALAADARSAFDEPAPPKALPRPDDKPGALAIVAGTPRDKHISSGFSDLPAGLVNVTLRPYPWESSPNLSLLLARIEQVEWYLLYALGVVGLVACVRRPRLRLALQYPIVLIALMTGMAAVTQGNLGTAFRHREQILWALALAAAAGAEHLRARRRAAVATSEDSGVEEPPRRAPLAARV